MAIIAAVVAGVLCGLEIAGAIFSYFSVYFGNLQMVKIIIFLSNFFVSHLKFAQSMFFYFFGYGK